MNVSDTANSPKVLIVEDERITAQFLTQTLTRLGFNVIGVASTGAAAIKEAAEKLPDLILADIGLQGPLDGVEVAQQLRMQWGIPTVFLTAYTDPETMARARLTEPYGYLVKPFDEQELHATLEIALQQRGLSEQRQQKSEANARLLERTRSNLNALAARLFSAQEDERQRIARDLHDDIGQRIALVQIRVEGVRRQFAGEGDGRTAAELGAAIDEIVKIADDLRTVAHRLHPSTIDDLGLPAALSQLANEFQTRQGKPAWVSVRDIPHDLSREVAIGLYRITQEALRNVTKHAGPAPVSIALMGGPASIDLSIRDAGKGFHFDKPGGHKGLGLISMAQRAELIGGTLELHSERGQGTRIHVRVPLSSAPAQRP
jgi:signal transduction histidine kinase